ncbi:hypothetical protein OG394_16225 [Kribbella sp. NBC_01245]|uniref:hypothetical protein n=1 Tax=Kribbella sp. NBC_01245 TaxID=2903578 RepID=UPI002E298ACE|nr:hypothetical protein [Kribbella sp. NBC_01245]
MAVYGVVWRAVCWLLGAVGVPLACIALPLDGVVAIVVLAIVVGGTTAAGHWSVISATNPSPGLARSAVFGVAACTAVLAIAGFAVLLGVGVVGLVLLVGMTSPQAIGWCGRLRGTSSAKAKVQADRPSKDTRTSTTSTSELCRQWQATYDALRRAESPEARLRIVQARQRCLDELERRDPDGLHAWLESNASAAGDPSRFLAGS